MVIIHKVNVSSLLRLRLHTSLCRMTVPVSRYANGSVGATKTADYQMKYLELLEETREEARKNSDRILKLAGENRKTHDRLLELALDKLKLQNETVQLISKLMETRGLLELRQMIHYYEQHKFGLYQIETKMQQTDKTGKTTLVPRDRAKTWTDFFDHEIFAEYRTKLMEDPVLSKEGMNAGRFGSFIVEINNHQNKSVHTFKHSYTSIVIPKDFSPELRKVSSCIIDYIGLEVEQEK